MVHLILHLIFAQDTLGDEIITQALLAGISHTQPGATGWLEVAIVPDSE